jgi:dynein heavy chain
VRLERSKDSFRDKVKTMLEAFLREIATMQEEFVRASPTNNEGTSSRAALAFIAKWKAAVAAARQKVRACGWQLCLFYICSRTGDVLCNEM